MNSLDKAKDRIRKLLEVARDDAATQGEIDNALSFAKKMMDAHHLSEDDLATEPADQYADIEAARKGRSYSYVGSKIYCWESRLANFVTDFVGGIGCYQLGVRIVRTAQGIVVRGDDGRIKQGRSFCFYGIAEDVRFAAELFDELRTTISGMAVLKFGGCYKGDGGEYSEGFIDGLRTKLYEGEKRERLEATTDSRSMVLIERRNDLVEHKLTLAKDYLKSIGVTLSSGRSRWGASGSTDARNEGRADGRQTPVNRTRTAKICK